MENVTYFVIANTWLKGKINVGWGNGYVVIPKGFPGFEMEYDDIHNKYDIDCPGGLTYSRSGAEGGKEWKELEKKYRTKDYWIVGFDTMHLGDSLEKWPKWRVEEEAAKLAFQFLQLKLLEERTKVTKEKK